jgi:preprotein translocase subunit SecD
MSKRARLITILLVVIVAGVFLYPTFNWYYLVPSDKKETAAGSLEQIRFYSQDEATIDFLRLNELAANEGMLPGEYGFLAEVARENYKLEGRKPPKKWSVADVYGSIGSEAAVFELLEAQYRDEILDLKDRSERVLQLGLDLSGGMSILLQADMDSLAERLGSTPTPEQRSDAVDRAMEILNNRIDKFGVTEPQIRQQGDDEIYIEIPGAADPERVYNYIRGKGSLNFHIVDEDATSTLNDYLQDNPGGLTSELVPKDPNILEAGRIIRGFYTKDEYGIDQLNHYRVLYEDVGLDGGHIQDATVGSDPITGRPVINFALDREGGEIFFQLTSANVNNTMAIVLDDRIKAGARISEAIRENVQMRGFEQKEADNLAVVLRTAALPVDLLVLNQQEIGASLGQDSIRRGIQAISLGFVLVIIFMVAYYKGAGLIADLALILNLIIIVSILSAFNLTLTLTSIAGLILTVGMAVDANVIVFERIKEEYRVGKSPNAAVKAGFRKAFWTVMDANITTFIAAIFLSQLGRGPIQGFAYTLSVGIVSSMFTALFVSRLIFDFSTDTLRAKKLSISWRI